MADIGDDWYESEESTTRGLIAELQRIKRRTLARPIIVLLLGALITAAIYQKISTKKPLLEAEVVVALNEQSLSTEERRSIPVDQLRDYVMSVLLPAKKLNAMIERRNLYPLRKTFGIDFAIASLWEQTDIQILQNTFVYFDESDVHALRSARIGITVSDTDPDKAFGIARDLAQIIIATSAEQRQEIAETLSADVNRVRDGLRQRIADNAKSLEQNQLALAKVRELGKRGLAAGYELDIANLYAEQKRLDGQLGSVLSNRDSIADRISAAGLDMSVEIVEETPPDKTQPRAFVTLLIMAIVACGALFGAALVIGAFDSRVHDDDDVERLGLPVLGHVPGFRGDRVGSLLARGAVASRVPSFLRWRSHR